MTILEMVEHKTAKANLTKFEQNFEQSRNPNLPVEEGQQAILRELAAAVEKTKETRGGSAPLTTRVAEINKNHMTTKHLGLIVADSLEPNIGKL